MITMPVPQAWEAFIAIGWWIKESRGDVRHGIIIDIKQGSGNIEIKNPILAPV
jgi:hypothetical protein